MAKPRRGFIKGIARPLKGFGSEFAAMVNPFLAYQRHPMRFHKKPSDWKYRVSLSRAFRDDLLKLPYGIGNILKGVFRIPAGFVDALIMKGLRSAFASLPKLIGEAIGFVVKGALQVVLSPLTLLFSLTTRPFASLVYKAREYQFTRARYLRNPVDNDPDYEALFRLANSEKLEQDLSSLILDNLDNNREEFRSNAGRTIEGALELAHRYDRMHLPLCLLVEGSKKDYNCDHKFFDVIENILEILEKRPNELSSKQKEMFKNCLPAYLSKIYKKFHTPGSVYEYTVGSVNKEGFEEVVDRLFHAGIVDEALYRAIRPGQIASEDTPRVDTMSASELHAEHESSEVPSFSETRPPASDKSQAELMAQQRDQQSRKGSEDRAESATQPHQDPNQKSDGPSGKK